MKLSERITNSRGKLQQFAPYVVFTLAALISVCVTWYVTGHYLDADASSELVLAKHLAETRQILSQDWYYGAEFRVLHMQLIYGPLMLLLNDWHVIRFVGAVIMQGLYILSFAYLTRQAGLRRETFWYGASLLLLPVSVTYGRIVLYHCHYLPNIISSFFLYGLVLHLQRIWDFRRLKCWVLLAALMLLSFLGGVNSLRYLMITHAPMLLGIVLLCLCQDSPDSSDATLLSKPVIPLLSFALLAAVCSAIGLVFNAAVLQKYYTDYQYYVENTALFMEADELNNLLYGYFHQFGFRQKARLVSVSGILSMGSLVAGVYTMLVSARTFRQKKSVQDFPRALILGAFASFTAVMALVFVVTGGIYYFQLYLSLCWPWAVVPLVETLGSNPRKFSVLHAKRLFAWTTILVLLASGCVNLAWYSGSSHFSQEYDGLGYQNRDIKAQLSGAADYLTENGYSVGYATYWNANILTEITNGDVQIICIEYAQWCDNVLYYDCFTSQWLREAPTDKAFLLMPSEGEENAAPPEVADCCRLVYEDEWFCVYDITDLDSFRILLSN